MGLTYLDRQSPFTMPLPTWQGLNSVDSFNWCAPPRDVRHVLRYGYHSTLLSPKNRFLQDGAP